MKSLIKQSLFSLWFVISISFYLVCLLILHSEIYLLFFLLFSVERLIMSQKSKSNNSEIYLQPTRHEQNIKFTMAEYLYITMHDVACQHAIHVQQQQYCKIKSIFFIFNRKLMELLFYWLETFEYKNVSFTVWDVGG